MQAGKSKKIQKINDFFLSGKMGPKAGLILYNGTTARRGKKLGCQQLGKGTEPRGSDGDVGVCETQDLREVGRRDLDLVADPARAEEDDVEFGG